LVKRRIKVLADANVDVWFAGNIDRSLPDEQQQLSPEVRQLADEMKAKVLKILLIPTSLSVQTLVVLLQQWFSRGIHGFVVHDADCDHYFDSNWCGKCNLS
jgi:hypothetical protein